MRIIQIGKQGDKRSLVLTIADGGWCYLSRDTSFIAHKFRTRVLAPSKMNTYEGRFPMHGIISPVLTASSLCHPKIKCI